MVRRFAEGVLPMVADGRLKPLVGKVLPLAQAAEAHRAMEAGGGCGKIVLKGGPREARRRAPPRAAIVDDGRKGGR